MPEREVRTISLAMFPSGAIVPSPHVLLDDDRQIHSLMNGTINVIGTGGGERTDIQAWPTQLQTIHLWPASRGRLRVLSRTVPLTIVELVERSLVLNKLQRVPLLQGNAGLLKIACVGLDSRARRTGAAAGR